jgi:hypothetical protein
VDPGASEGLYVQPVRRGVHADLQEVAQAHGAALHQVGFEQIWYGSVSFMGAGRLSGVGVLCFTVPMYFRIDMHIVH